VPVITNAQTTTAALAIAKAKTSTFEYITFLQLPVGKGQKIKLGLSDKNN